MKSRYPRVPPGCLSGFSGAESWPLVSQNNEKDVKIISAKKSLKLLGKELLYALIGLGVSMILALAINNQIHNKLIEMIF
ncbi:MAG: hypothetical protein IH947_00195 [Bacteroidetes bacterium]|nr:hypothetical protein [Bacteroidota bacterium]